MHFTPTAARPRKKRAKKMKKKLQKFWRYKILLYLCTRNPIETVASSKHNAEIAQLVEHNLAKVGVASSSLVFRSKSKSFEDKIKQNPLKHRFRGFFIGCRLVSFRHRGAPIRHSQNLEVSLRISTVKIRDTYSETRGHFDIFSAFHKLFRLAVAYTF